MGDQSTKSKCDSENIILKQSDCNVYDKSKECQLNKTLNNLNSDSVSVKNENSTAELQNSPIVNEKNGAKNANHTIPSSSDSAKHRPSARKHRLRHVKRRKWKPYNKLTWNERRKLEERDARRAYRIREEMTAHGLTLAPYNTTQFLMEDHNLQEPDYEHMHHESKHGENHNGVDSDDFYGTPDDEEDFLQQQFLETYDSARDAYIHNLEEYELVEELIRLEDEVEILETSLQEAKNRNKSSMSSELDVDAELEKIKIFEDEIEKLTHENEILGKKNERLLKILAQKI